MLNFRNRKTGEELLDAEEEKADYFSGPDIPDEPQKPKPPVLRPDDPEYWLQEESRWEHLRPNRGRRLPSWLYILLCIVIAGGALAVWLRYFRPYVREAEQCGYVDSVQYRGVLFRTYEGTLVPPVAVADTAGVYAREFIFSANSDSVGRKLMEYSHLRQPVCVSYRKYHATLPWRGETRILITDVRPGR